jgi:hypothetical protein
MLTRLIAFAGFNIVRCCEGGRAPVRSGEYDLIGVLLPEIPHCENARDIGFAFFIRDKITCAVGLEPGGNQLVVGGKTDENENPFGINIPLRTGLGVLPGDVADAVGVIVDGGDYRIVYDFNSGFRENPLPKNSAFPKSIPPADEVDPAGDL